jgi:hypothetical protein
MLKIKLSIPGFDRADISQFTGNADNTIRDCVFYVNNDEIKAADYWVCLEGPYRSAETCLLKRKNVIYLAAEVAWPRFFYDTEHKKNFLTQFGKIYTCHDIYAENAVFDLPYLPWMINANHGHSVFAANSRDRHYFEDLTNLSKPKLLSVFCSNQTWTDDHKMRLKFVKALKVHFGDNLDWYGNGINSIDKKWEGIAPYKYHIVLENQSRNNVITEKLYDSFLGLAYPIYYGAPNAGDYFDKNSFSTIDITDLKGSIKIIEKILEVDFYEKKLAAIIESKNLVLSKFNLFERIADICMTAEAGSLQSDFALEEEIVLMPMSYFTSVQDFAFLLKEKSFYLLFKRLAFYYPAHLLRKFSNKLLQIYENKY